MGRPSAADFSRDIAQEPADWRGTVADPGGDHQAERATRHHARLIVDAAPGIRSRSTASRWPLGVDPRCTVHVRLALAKGADDLGISTLAPSIVYLSTAPNRKDTPMTSSDTTKVQEAPSGGHGHDHPFQVTVRTLAGHHVSETVRPDDTVAELTAKAIEHFVAKGELVPGDYALTLPRTGGEAELDPTAILRDAGVVEGDVLVLVSRQPHVDG